MYSSVRSRVLTVIVLLDIKFGKELSSLDFVN